MRKVGIQTSAYFGLDGMEEGFYNMAACGYQAADYQNFINTDNGLFELSDREFEAYCIKTRRAAEAAGIAIFQTHGPWRYPPHDATVEQREERFEKMVRSLYGTALLGSPYMVIHPLMPFGPDDDPDPVAFRELNLAFWRRLLVKAHDAGVVLCLENMPMRGLSISGPEATLQMVEELHDPMMGFCLDTGHAAVLGKSPADAVRMLGERLSVLHVHDNNGMGDFHMYPYQGVIDWEDFRLALMQSPSKAALSLETAAPKTLPPAAKAAMEKALYETARYLAGGAR